MPVVNPRLGAIARPSCDPDVCALLTAAPRLPLRPPDGQVEGVLKAKTEMPPNWDVFGGGYERKEENEMTHLNDKVEVIAEKIDALTGPILQLFGGEGAARRAPSRSRSRRDDRKTKMEGALAFASRGRHKGRGRGELQVDERGDGSVKLSDKSRRRAKSPSKRELAEERERDRERDREREKEREKERDQMLRSCYQPTGHKW